MVFGTTGTTGLAYVPRYSNPDSGWLRTQSMTAPLLYDVGAIAWTSIGAYGERVSRPRRLSLVSSNDGLNQIDRAAALMDRVQRGDRSAFADLYDELAPVVYGVCLRVLRDPSLSEEVTQEIFVEIWKTSTRFDGTRGNVRTWAATIAHRRAVDRVRSVEASRRRDQADADGRESEASGVDDEVVSRLQSDVVRAALDVLSEKQRKAIELAYFDGLSYREVAVVLDLPEGTVKTRIRDGMHRLRTELGGAPQ